MINEETELNLSLCLPVAGNVLIHVIKVVVQLLNPVRRITGLEDELLLVVAVLGVLKVSLVEPFLLLILGILQPILVVPDLQLAAGHDDHALHVIVQSGPLAPAERFEAGRDTAELSLLSNPDGMEGVASFAAVLVEENGTDPSDIVLIGAPPARALLDETERLDVGEESHQDHEQLHPLAVGRRV